VIDSLQSVMNLFVELVISTESRCCQILLFIEHVTVGIWKETKSDN